MSEGVLTLQEAADELGVHYMTAYRYVRLGQLEAYKAGGGWRVPAEVLDAFRRHRAEQPTGGHKTAPWSERLESRLVAGDAAGAWSVVEAAMTAGTSVSGVYLEMLTPAMRSIGSRWESGEIDISIEHRASGIATRLIGRLGSRCVRRGRSRGTVVMGAPVGERHGIVVAVLADLLRLAGWDVSDLGADTPSSSFVAAATTTDDLVAVALSVTHPEHLEACAEACAALRDAGLGVPVIVGGQAIRDEQHAQELHADTAACGVSEMISLLDGLRGGAEH
ncbi:MAG: cobalamin-dependent protein [Ilumatobacter sp.]|uniref:cobalamin-dependent protein n=1 Tax=Ilumatobacter sp. TaxID=1967498 RepID=UPI002609980D|nr:cobalamin-dependent protein [Ilumatobacter sp.]MDJ0771415.1 cobalamin-dependent protein [Ilumatobacter sp.]